MKGRMQGTGTVSIDGREYLARTVDDGRLGGSGGELQIRLNGRWIHLDEPHKAESWSGDQVFLRGVVAEIKIALLWENCPRGNGHSLRP